MPRFTLALSVICITATLALGVFSLNAADPAARSALNEDAKAVIAEYLAYTQSNPLLQQLDGDTPFGMKLSINTTMAATLKALQASLR